MGKGGDETTTTTSSSLPGFIEPYYKDLLARAQGASNQAYTPYENPRIENFSPDMLKAFNMIRNGASAGTPGVDSALTAAQQLSGYNAKSFDYTGVPGMNVDAYMNPYTENVLDKTNQMAERRFQEQQQTRNADAVAAGAFGGDRRFVSDSLARRDFNEQADLRNATGMNAAFDRATGLFTEDQGRRLQTQVAGEEARRLGKTLGLDAVRTRGDLSKLQQDMRFRNIDALSGVGARIQGRGQAGLDMAYNDFVQQRDWPSNQLKLYSQLLSGTPVSPSTTSTVKEPTPDFLSQLIGLGTTGAGIWDLFND